MTPADTVHTHDDCAFRRAPASGCPTDAEVAAAAQALEDRTGMRSVTALDLARTALAAAAAVRSHRHGRAQPANRQVNDATVSVGDPLSPRENEVTSLVIDGLFTTEIAELLGLSPKTIEVHRRRAIAKLGARNTADYVRLAFQLGIAARSPS